MLFSGHIVGRRCFWNGPHSSQGFRPLPLSIIWPSNFVYWNILKPSPQYSRFPLLNIFSHIQPTPHTFCSQGYVDHLIGLGLFHFIVSQGGWIFNCPSLFLPSAEPNPYISGTRMTFVICDVILSFLMSLPFFKFTQPGPNPTWCFIDPFWMLPDMLQNSLHWIALKLGTRELLIHFSS